MRRNVSIALLLFSMNGAFAQTWTGATDDTYNTATNWSGPATVPNAIDATAVFGSAITTATTITLNVSATLGTLNFDNANAYTITAAAAQTFTFDVSSGNAAINVTSGSHTVNPDIVLSDNLAITQNSSGTLTLAGAISGASRSVTKSGVGTLSLTGDSSAGFSGGFTLQAGTVAINSDNALGLTGTAITISGGTLQAGAGITSGRNITLSGAGTVDTNGNSVTLSGVISSTGSLTVASSTGSGTLILSGANTYSGGTAIGSSSTLSISSDGNLGNTAGAVVIDGGTLDVTASFSSARAISLANSNTFSTNGNTLTLSGAIGGSGSFTKTGAGTLVLTGTNTYSGGITVSAGTLQGNTASILGNIANSGTVVFDQSSSGTYSGVLTGAGALTKQGSGTLIVTGSSGSFSGATTVSAGTLQVNGSLAGSAVTVNSGATLVGNSAVGAVTNNGTIANSDSSSILTITGDLTSGALSTTSVKIASGSAGKITATGTANVDGNLTVTPASGFYGLSSTYSVVTGSSVAGTFSSLSIVGSGFTGSLSYPGAAVVLTLFNSQPFFNFAFSNSNTQSVGENINALSAAGTLAADIDLQNIINTFTGLSTNTINQALDQMHPAQMGSFAELQFELGGQLLSLFHHRPNLLCSCSASNRIWIEPFGNWLHEKTTDENLGFHARSRGIAFGCDGEVLNGWTVGIGGAWNATDLKWSDHRGYSYVGGLYGAIYTDYTIDNFYIGASGYAGNDWYDNHRHIQFTTINRTANSKYNGLDAAGQVTAAYYFGTPLGFLYPYATVDYLYLRNHNFREHGADSLDLSVDVYRSNTLRTEAGFALQTNDKNRNETICISPFVSCGWVMERPMDRDDFISTFADQTIPFNTQGWKETRQLINIQFGLGITYECFTLDSQYFVDISPDGGFPYFNQRANFRLQLNF